MAIVRISSLGDTVFAPNRAGTMEMDDYNHRRRVGRMGQYPRPRLAGARDDLRRYMDVRIGSATERLQTGGPIVVLIHGFLFDPKCALSPDPKDTDNPHGRLFHFQMNNESEEQRHHTTSWPLGLGIDENDAGESGLALAFGWQSQPGFASSLINHFENFYARAYDKATLSAWLLINVLREIGKVVEDRPIDIFCHSLGARVVIRTIALAAKYADDPALGKFIDPLIPRLGRVIILGGSEYVVEAQLMQRRLTQLKQSRKEEQQYSIPDFYNFVSRENDVLDKLAENFGPRTFGSSQVIGHNGLASEGKALNWINLQIDSPKLQAWMKRRHFEISGDRPENVWDHWYYFTFRRNMEVYRSILRDRSEWVISKLRADADPVPDDLPKPTWPFGD